LLILEIGSCFFLKPTWTEILFYTFHFSWDDRCIPLPSFCLKWGLANFLPRLASISALLSQRRRFLVSSFLPQLKTMSYK
jgi:hypothetical protein